MLEARHAVRAVRAPDSAHRDGRARGPLPHAAAFAGRDRERRRRPLEHPASCRRSTAPTRGSCRSSAATSIPGRSALPLATCSGLSSRSRRARDGFQVTAPTDAAGTAAASSARRSAAAPAPRRRGRALLLAFTILARPRAAARRDRRSAAPALVRGAPLAGRAVHARRIGSARARSGRSSAGCVGGAVAAVVAGTRGSPAWPVVAHALLSRGGLLGALAGRSRPPRAAALSRPCAPGRTARPAHVHPARRRGGGAIAIVLVGWRAGSVDAQRSRTSGGTSAFLLLVPALSSSRPRSLPRACSSRRCAASAGRPPRADRAAACRRLARAQSGPRGDRGDVPRREPRPRALRRHYRSTLSAASRTRRPTRSRRRMSSARTCQLVPVLTAHGAALRRRPQVLRLSGNVPSGTTFTFLGLARQRSRRRAAGAATSPAAAAATRRARRPGQGHRRSARRRCRAAGGSRSR